MHYDQSEDSHKNHTTKNSEDILADFKPIDPANPPNVSFSFKTQPIFPDSGASICLGGPIHLKLLDIHPENLIPCKKLLFAVGGSKLLFRVGSQPGSVSKTSKLISHITYL